MADNAAPAAAPAHQDNPNLQKDEVTGEMVSKSELKKRQKKREGDKRKVLLGSSSTNASRSADTFPQQAEKAAAAPPKPAKAEKQDGAPDLEELTPNVRPIHTAFALVDSN